MADGKLCMNISKSLDVSMRFRWTKAHQPVYHYHKGGATHVDDVQHAGMHTETRNVRSRKDDARNDGDVHDRRSDLLASRVTGQRLLRTTRSEASAAPGCGLPTVSCLTAARRHR
ncbi:hypothetical protein NSPZN2_70196 [Nitrospira defluvii]|uniref:Uncharacterized protein n=1 Tax=Nitrospira defluvii TaxID=330214 RepID=A0ABM8SAN5_9BACT|nr:hypothetical protein NSPZN2_70196 [Nitrospira defluvii]